MCEEINEGGKITVSQDTGYRDELLGGEQTLKEGNKGEELH